MCHARILCLQSVCPQLRGRPAAECIPRARSRARLRTACGSPLTPPMSNRHSPSVKPVLLSRLRKVKGRRRVRFHLIGSVEAFRAECGCWPVTREPVDLDKAGNFGPGPSESISMLRSSAERWARRMREHQAKRPERAHQQNRLSRSGNQHFIAIFSTLPRARVVRLRQHG